jgi:hypothetical protein
MSILIFGPRPTPARERLARGIVKISPLTVVAAGIAAATEFERSLYVERFAGGFRWSMAHRGGPYPLLRVTARFLGLDHWQVMVGCGPAPVAGWSIIPRPSNAPEPIAHALLDFDGPTPADVVERRVSAALGTHDEIC